MQDSKLRKKHCIHQIRNCESQSREEEEEEEAEEEEEEQAREQ